MKKNKTCEQDCPKRVSNEDARKLFDDDILDDTPKFLLRKEVSRSLFRPDVTHEQVKQMAKIAGIKDITECCDSCSIRPYQEQKPAAKKRIRFSERG